jgi:hypothetical protein
MSRLLVPLALAFLALAPSTAQAQSGCIAQGRRLMLSPSVQRSFPQLGTRFRVIGCATPRYNCIAHTIGTHQRWVWPGDSVAAFNTLYGRHGYRRITRQPGRIPAGQFRQQPGVDRIVLYAKPSGRRFSCTHGALQHPRGGWTSKLGKLPLIWHPSPYSVAGPSYGRPIAVYVRRHR